MCFVNNMAEEKHDSLWLTNKQPGFHNHIAYSDNFKT